MSKHVNRVERSVRQNRLWASTTPALVRFAVRRRLLLASALATAIVLLSFGAWLGVEISILPLSAALIAVVAIILLFDDRDGGAADFGLANTVTFVRGLLAAGLAGFVGTAPSEATVWAIAGLALISLSLDGLDGWIARRKGEISEFGGRFDMETDALLLLILCALVVQADKAGAWALTIGLMRYGFVAAGALIPALRAPLPPSGRRKAVCVLQGLALSICLMPIVPAAVSAPVIALSLVCLTLSFAVDSRWLVRTGLPPLQTERTAT